MAHFTFPVGYHTLHKTKIIDFQLNRWYSLGYARLDDMREAAARIRTLADWKGEMVRQATRAMDEGRRLNGTFYYRAAEFFTHASDPDKHALYERFIDLFYTDLFANEALERYSVPYGNAYLPALRIPHHGDGVRGTIVIHGGFDSFIEEFYSIAWYFAQRGYDLVLFDGPGQGGALRTYGLPIEYTWERPARAILDYFDLHDVTWLGISMGGWLCFRAAAHESRIQRVIASSIAYDYMQIPPQFIATFARWLLKHPRMMDTLSDWKMRMLAQEKWGIDNLKYITGTSSTVDAARALLEFNAENLQSGRVTQDVLILTGAADHFIPLKMHRLQVAALTHAHSITERIFTAAEHGQNHCQIGNMGLALEVMADWIATRAQRSESHPVSLTG